MSCFRFKEFAIRQSDTPMKVGTDGVLLGAWTRIDGDEERILDIGTGTGVIALMMAQRTSQAEVVGVDIDSVEEARYSGDQSPWAARVRFLQTPIQAFQAEPFDLIVSNPPFFTESLKCPDRGRTMARHAVALPFEELRDAVARLLHKEGRFAFVLPLVEAEHFIRLCEGVLRPIRRTEVRTTPRHPAKRLLVEMVHENASMRTFTCDELMIGTGEHETYTEAYRALTCDFYLKF